MPEHIVAAKPELGLATLGQVVAYTASFSISSSRDTWSAMSTKSLTRLVTRDPPRPRGVKVHLARFLAQRIIEVLSPAKLLSL